MVVTQLIETGYPHYRQAAGFPGWLLPECQMTRLTRELGDDGTHRLAAGIIGTEEVEAVSIPDEVWRHHAGQWAPISQVATGAVALLAAGERLLGCYRRGTLHIDPEVICRALSVLFLAPLVPAGNGLARSLAQILGMDSLAIAGLIDSYAERVVSEDLDLVERVDKCICLDQTWWAWLARFLHSAKEFPFMPKSVAVTPPLTPLMAETLASLMIKGGTR